MAQSFGSSGWTMKMSGMKAAQRALNDVSIQFDGSKVYVVGPTTSYAVHHELGTSKMGARPFMRPAAEKVRNDKSHWAQKVASSQGIPLNSQENIVKCVALAVAAEARAIATRKDVKDTGDTIASIQAREV